MTEYEQTMNVIEEMRSRFDSGFSSSDKETIVSLYQSVCGKKVRNTRCGDCYRDAFVEIRAKLKKLGTMPKQPNYVLKAGVLFHPAGTSDFYVLDKITDEIAEKELAKNPDFINKFQIFPSDYLERVKARTEGNPYEEADSVASLKKQVALLKGQLAEASNQLTEAKAKIADLEASTDKEETVAASETETTNAEEVKQPKARKTATKK